MFRITAETCRTFTLAEVLILAAVNLESARLGCESNVRPGMVTTQTRHRSASHFIRMAVRKALQLHK
jgi:hypothetical protein